MTISGTPLSASRLAVSTALALTLVGAGAAIAASGPGDQASPAPWAQSLSKVDRNTAWDLASRTHLDFDTFHPQGFALVGDRIFMSSVEIIEPPVKYPSPVDGYDRTTGRGVGHVFVMTREGELIKDIVVGEGTMYHPGGIDFDGESVWVPAAEYRPNSRSIVYRIDPRILKVRAGDTLRMFAAPDDSGEAAGTELLVYEARPGQ